MKQILVIFLLLLSFLDAKYLLKPSYREKTKIDKLPKNSVADMKILPQDLSFYAKQVAPFDTKIQKELDREYNREYFEPWTQKSAQIDDDKLGWEVRFVEKEQIFTVLGKLIEQSEIQKWIENENMDAFDTQRLRAITLRRVDLKAFPTSIQYFKNPKRPGEGFPFDYNQNSAYPINMPLFVSHLSKDGKWAFVKGAYAFGWVQTKDIAFVDDAFIKKFKNGNYAMSIKDNLRLFDDDRDISLIKLGTLFPYTQKGYMFATKDEKGMAKIAYFKATAKGIISHKPLQFNAKNVAMIAAEFQGEPYGWGECYETRDCSATTRDFFAIFGIFLERNSAEQAKNGRYVVDISDIEDVRAKKDAIIKYAKPFRSMLFVPGHIVLYIGEYQNEPVILHTYWGVRQEDWSKLITARTIITTTQPGKELENTREESALIKTLKSIVIF